MKLDYVPDEFKARHARAVDKIAASGMDAIMVTSEANINYFTGFRHHAPWTTFTRPEILIIPVDHDPVLIVQGFLVFDTRLDSWVQDVRGYPGLTGTPVAMVVDVIKELGLMGKRIGAELGYEQRLGMPINDFLQIQQTLGAEAFVDASHLLWQLRMIKSEAEITAHRRACELTTLALNTCFSQARAGSTEKDIARDATKVIVDGGAELGFTILCSGEGNYERTAGMPTNRTIQEGDLVWFDLGAVANGYWSDFCRAAVVGGPTDAQKRFQDIVVNITHKPLQQVRPGIKASELARMCGRAAEEFNIDLNFEAGRLGHGVGLMSTEPPHIAVYDDTILEPGMVITLEPGIVNEHGTFIAEENLVVRPDGFELLSLATRELRVI